MRWRFMRFAARVADARPTAHCTISVKTTMADEDVEEAAQAAKLLDRLAPDVDHREEDLFGCASLRAAAAIVLLSCFMLLSAIARGGEPQL